MGGFALFSPPPLGKSGFRARSGSRVIPFDFVLDRRGGVLFYFYYFGVGMPDWTAVLQRPCVRGSGVYCLSQRRGVVCIDIYITYTANSGFAICRSGSAEGAWPALFKREHRGSTKGACLTLRILHHILGKQDPAIQGN